MKRPKLKSSHRSLKDVVQSPKITIDPPDHPMDETPGTDMDTYFRMLERLSHVDRRGAAQTDR